MKEKLLFLSAHLPTAKSGQAGHKTAFRNLVWLSQSYDVWLVCFSSLRVPDADRQVLEGICREVSIFPLDNRHRLLGILRGWRMPLAVSARLGSVRAIERVKRLSHEIEFCRVHFEWEQMAYFSRYCADTATKSLYVHDVLSEWASRRSMRGGAWFWRFEAWRLRRWEGPVLRRLQRIYIPSEKDRILLLKHAGLEQALAVLPLYFDTYGGGVRHRGGLGFEMIFWGAMARIENAEAVRWLARKVMPALRARGLNVRLNVVGAFPPKDILDFAADDFVISGFVDDPGDWFARSQLAVLPLFQGAGVKVKVLECLASGIPCLTTQIGAEGIDACSDDGLLVREGVEAFVSEIERLYGNRNELATMSAAARAWGGRQTSNYSHVIAAS